MNPPSGACAWGLVRSFGPLTFGKDLQSLLRQFSTTQSLAEPVLSASWSHHPTHSADISTCPPTPRVDRARAAAGPDARSSGILEPQSHVQAASIPGLADASAVQAHSPGASWIGAALHHAAQRSQHWVAQPRGLQHHCSSSSSPSASPGLCRGSSDGGVAAHAAGSHAAGSSHYRAGGLLRKETGSAPPAGTAAAGTAPWPESGTAARHLHSSRGSSFAAGAAEEGGGGPRRTGFRDVGLGAPMEVFDRSLKALHRDRSALLLDSGDPLLGLVAERLLDRLEDCRRSFPTAVVLGGAALPVLHQLAGGRAGIERVVVVDSSQEMLDRVKREEAESRQRPGAKPWPRVLCVRGDEEHLPLRPGSVNLIISCLGLHWANDLPGAMAQCRLALVPDGLFLAALFGGDTLQELRISCALAQMERQGGVSAVVSPLAQVRDAGNLLTRADLRLPSVDVDRFTLGYPSPLELVQHLRALGESNAANQRRWVLSRDAALAAAAVYQSMFGGEEGGVTATYEVIFMTGWSPAATQPKAAQRGSATVSFQDLADGLVKGGTAVGGTADEGVLAGPDQPTQQQQQPEPPPPQRQQQQQQQPQEQALKHQ